MIIFDTVFSSECKSEYLDGNLDIDVIRNDFTTKKKIGQI